jgi:hypothetical protein
LRTAARVAQARKILRESIREYGRRSLQPIVRRRDDGIVTLVAAPLRDSSRRAAPAHHEYLVRNPLAHFANDCWLWFYCLASMLPIHLVSPREDRGRR